MFSAYSNLEPLNLNGVHFCSCPSMSGTEAVCSSTWTVASNRQKTLSPKFDNIFLLVKQYLIFVINFALFQENYSQDIAELLLGEYSRFILRRNF